MTMRYVLYAIWTVVNRYFQDVGQVQYVADFAESDDDMETGAVGSSWSPPDTSDDDDDEKPSGSKRTVPPTKRKRRPHVEIEYETEPTTSTNRVTQRVRSRR